MTATAAAAAVMVVAGCSGPAADTTATATTAADTEARAAVMIPAAPGDLDSGLFDTTPSHYPTAAGDPEVGGVVESQRMAEFLVLPAEIDPALTEAKSDYTRPIFGPFPLAYLLDDGSAVVERIGEDTGMYAGFSTARSTSDGKARMVHAVLQFRDAEAASDAAVRLHEHLMDPDPPTPSYAFAHPVPAMPDSLIHAVDDGDSRRVTALTAHGHYLVYTFLAAPIDRASWVDQALEHALVRQLPLIEKFPYTTPAGLADLPVDIDELLHRTLPYPDEEGAAIPAVYGPRGAAHLLRQLDTLEVFEDTSATHMSRDGAFVYATDFPDRAEHVFDRVVGQVRNQNTTISTTTAAGPAGVPDVRCFEVIPDLAAYGDGAVCVLLYDTLVAEIRTSTLGSAHQATTAQYRIFQAT
ncbi:MAG: hypothetical protein WAX14_14605, partial [Rhodococcus sp. (in: high G+C Gram-positive bacteria)]|uniref:DUF7373 family lipoprotein n=1 Tax=Rhodococcus sp. TaxID=1831 RepID=UPI003BB4F643